jgi:hypothetical protein
MDEGQFRLYQIERIMTINAASHTWPSKPTPEDAEEALEAAMLEVEKEKGQVLGGQQKKLYTTTHTQKTHILFFILYASSLGSSRRPGALCAHSVLSLKYLMKNLFVLCPLFQNRSKYEEP